MKMLNFNFLVVANDTVTKKSGFGPPLPPRKTGNFFFIVGMRKPPSDYAEDAADLRVVFAADVVSQVLSKLAAPLGRSVAKNVSLPGFPKHPLCTADVVVYPSSANAILRYDHVQSFSFP